MLLGFKFQACVFASLTNLACATWDPNVRDIAFSSVYDHVPDQMMSAVLIVENVVSLMAPPASDEIDAFFLSRT